MKVFVFLPLLSLLGVATACGDQTTKTTMMTTTTTPTTTTTTTKTPIVTRQPTNDNSCIGNEGATIITTISKTVALSAGNIVSTTYQWTGTGTQTFLCYKVVDRNTPPNNSVFVKTAGNVGDNTVTFTAFSASGQSINADLIILGTL